MSAPETSSPRPVRRFLPDRLHKRLTLFILLILLLPGIAIPLFTLPYLRQAFETGKLRESLDQARQQARILENLLEIRAVELLMISQLPELRRWVDSTRPEDRERERNSLVLALQSHLLKHSGRMDGLLLTNLNGIQEFQIEGDPQGEVDLRPLPHAHQPYVIGALHLSAIQGQNLPIHIAHPDPLGPLYFSTLIRSSQGEIAGVIVMKIHLSTLVDSLRTGGPGELCHVFDKEGEVLLSPDACSCMDFLRPHVDEVLRNPGGHLAGPGGRDGFFFVHARARPQGQSAIQWTLVYRVPLLQIAAPFQTALLRIGLITLGSLILALLLTLQFSRQLTRPITRLAEAANDLCHGYWNTELPPIRYRDEIGELTDSFASMSRQLRAAHEDLLHKLGELEASQASLASEKERLDVTLRSIGDAVIVTDLAGVILLVNPVAETLLGKTAAALVGTSFAESVPIHNQTLDGPLEDPLPQMLKQRPLLFDRQELVLQGGGGSLPVQLTASPICNPGSEIVGMIAVIRDMRALHNLHAEKTRAEKLQSLGVLAGGIAHDFNNLLSVIMGDLSLLLSTSAESPDHKPLRHALEAACRSRDLTAQLLSFSKGGLPIKENTRLSALIEETVTFALHGTACRHSLTAPPDLWLCPVDPAQMHQVFHNLSINAAQAMPDGGDLSIQLENVCLEELDVPGIKAGTYLRIQFQDQGCGIPASDLPSIFDPYFSTKPNGNGLGLSSVYSILRAHGGGISVKSSSSGTLFVLHIPATPDAIHSRKEEPDPPKEIARIEHARILLLDDDANICRTVGRLLRHLGYEVDTVQDAREAIILFQKGSHDLVILDLTLPGTLSGTAVLEKLRALRPDVRAIVSSGYSHDPVMAEPRKYGFVSRIPKPYTLEELKHCVQDALS